MILSRKTSRLMGRELVTRSDEFLVASLPTHQKGGYYG